MQPRRSTDVKHMRRSDLLLVVNGEVDDAFVRAVQRYPLRLLTEPRRGVSFARNHVVRLFWVLCTKRPYPEVLTSRGA
jgi:hypothetical protein